MVPVDRAESKAPLHNTAFCRDGRARSYCCVQIWAIRRGRPEYRCYSPLSGRFDMRPSVNLRPVAKCPPSTRTRRRASAANIRPDSSNILSLSQPANFSHWRMFALLCPAPRVGGIKRWCASDVCLSDVCLSVAYIGPKSRTERPRTSKFGIEVAHVTRDSDTTFKVKRYCHAGGGGILWRPPAQLVRSIECWLLSLL